MGQEAIDFETVAFGMIDPHDDHSSTPFHRYIYRYEIHLSI